MLRVQLFKSNQGSAPTSPGVLYASVVTCVAAAVLAGSASAAAWQVFESKAGRFRIDMPGKPVETSETRRTIVGMLTGYRFEVENEDSFFLVEYRDLPGVARLFMSTESLVEQAADGLLDFAGGPAQKNEVVEIRGHHARSLRYARKERENQIVRAQVILAEKRLYLVIAGVPDRRGEDARVERFFDSFAFWPEP